jgi:hypothetical protein
VGSWFLGSRAPRPLACSEEILSIPLSMAEPAAAEMTVEELRREVLGGGGTGTEQAALLTRLWTR